MADEIAEEWFRLARMDYETAEYLAAHMVPAPLEIICYHCQQAVEKLLKGLLIREGEEIRKTHDLGLLAEMLQNYREVPEEYLSLCDSLTPYGVKVRYPQEMDIQPYHMKEALAAMKKIFEWAGVDSAE